MVHDDLNNHEDKLDSIIYEDIENGIQVRLTISEFLGRHYLGIRKYYLSFEGDWLPTKVGMSFPYTLDSVTKLYGAFADILSKAEVTQEVIENYTKEELHE